MPSSTLEGRSAFPSSFDCYRNDSVMSLLVSTVCWAIAIFFMVNLPWCFALPIACAMLLATWMIRGAVRGMSATTAD